MKSQLRSSVLLVTVLIFSSGFFLRANEVGAIRGTINTEQEFEPGRYRTVSRPLTLKSICDALGVSQRDYRLYSSTDETNLLALKPRFPISTNLPSFVLLQTNGRSRGLRIWDGRLGQISAEQSVTNAASPAYMFNEFRGTALSRVTSHGTPSGQRPGLAYEVSGSSTNAILKFRFTVRPCIFPTGCP